MKKFFILFLLLSLPCFVFAKATYIVGKIDPKSSDTITLSGFKNIADIVSGSMETIALAVLQRDGSFMLKCNLKQGTVVDLKNGDRWLFYNAFIVPGDSIVFNMRKETMDIDGRGAEKIEYTFREIDTFYGKSALGLEYQHSFADMDINTFAAYLLKRRDQQLRYFHDLFRNKKLDGDFENYMTAEINYQYATDKLQYLWRHNYAWQKKGDIHPDASYFLLPKDIPLENPKALASFQYCNFLAEYINALWNDKEDALDSAGRRAFTKTQYPTKFKMADSIYHKPYRDIAKARWLNNRLQFMSFDAASLIKARSGMDSLMNAWHKTDPDSSLYDFIHATYIHVFSLQGQPAADFILNDINGKAVKLSDYKGKVILLDFWQTNCGPCLKEIPYANKLEKKMKGKDFVVLDICFGTNRDDWHTILEKKGWNGIHLYSDDMSMFRENYNLEYSFPQYVLIDKEGKIVTTNGNRPSTGVEKDIEKLLGNK